MAMFSLMMFRGSRVQDEWNGGVFDVSADSSQVEYRNGGVAHDLL
jgi:hypothetical protein